MIKNYFKVAFRNLGRKKLISFINILGLSLGLAFFGLICIYIYDEWRTDKTQPANLYRVITSYDAKNMDHDELATVGRALVGAISEEVPEVNSVIPLRSAGFSIGHKKEYFYEEIVYAGEHFLKAFNYALLAGDPGTALQQPYSLVLTEKTAKKYFETADVVGRTLNLNDTIPCTVTAVIKNPGPSHIDFDILLSFSTFTTRGGDMSQWFTWDMTSYVQLKDHADPKATEKKISALSMLHNKSEYDHVGYNVGHKLEAVRDIYLHSNLGGMNTKTGKISQLYVFGIIGLALLVLACINFVNLTTAYQLERVKEVGVRKTIGASAPSLRLQFFTETFLMVILSGFIGFIFITLLLPYVGTIAEKELSISILAHPSVIIAGIGLLAITTVLAGWYPSLLLSRYRPMQSFRLHLGSKDRSVFAFRKVLVVFQFLVSILLIAGTVTASRQLKFMQEQPLGFSSKQVVVLPLRKIPYKVFRDNYESIRQQLLQVTGAVSVSSAAAMPGRTGWDGQVVVPEGFTEKNSLTMEVIPVDHHYVRTLGINMRSGRDYSAEFSTDGTNGVLLNETACKMIGWTPEEAIGKVIQTSGMNEGKVIGVMKDYHQHGLKQKIGPVLTFINPYSYGFMAVRSQPGRLAPTITSIEKFWKARFPGYPFEYFMLDDDFNLQYKAEKKLTDITTLFSGLTILIACLGLFGLVAYSTQQKVKEIGIRKVLGAGVSSITIMLSKDFLKLVIIASAIAFPLGWLLMNEWLSDFAYKINVSAWIFIAAGLIVLLVALVTVSFQAIKAAIANPVKSLRTE